ncbi:hypothetical protein R3X26_12945 [Vibrio sp. TH_r3]|uniref:hypothetical protein n=1 Tax=Vibrio sp. TH_r3 TaxID=3082084 RepID=UPI002955BC7C|nr:hypothetical protein [Vibrio sp. TH_r3]MDV7105311.1 hypothetical protein [Vibrio sp. TH_r3]
MNNKIGIILTLAFSLISSMSYANHGSITFYGKVVEPTCSVANSLTNARLEIAGCKNSINANQTSLNIPLSDISTIAKHQSSNRTILDNLNKLAHQHNIEIDIKNVYSKTRQKIANTYVIELSYY